MTSPRRGWARKRGDRPEASLRVGSEPVDDVTHPPTPRDGDAWSAISVGHQVCAHAVAHLSRGVEVDRVNRTVLPAGKPKATQVRKPSTRPLLSLSRRSPAQKSRKMSCSKKAPMLAAAASARRSTSTGLRCRGVRLKLAVLGPTSCSAAPRGRVRERAAAGPS